MSYRDFLAGDPIDLGDGLTVATAALNHPGGATGYRIGHGGHAMAYVTDHEHATDGPSPDLLALVRGADLMIYDATFTPDEYGSRIGWGHSTWAAACDLADRAGVGQVALFHHSPGRDDAELAAIEQAAAMRRPGTFAAREGQVVRLEHTGEA
jgi:phosphoribosyl 1,2-cyclic phosphodiesterase